jgi:ABC-type transporter Mla subunit MlaD
MWIAFFVVLGIVVAVLCVFAAIRLNREEDQPTNLVTPEQMEQMEADDRKSRS